MNKEVRDLLIAKKFHSGAALAIELNMSYGILMRALRGGGCTLETFKLLRNCLGRGLKPKHVWPEWHNNSIAFEKSLKT